MLERLGMGGRARTRTVLCLGLASLCTAGLVACSSDDSSNPTPDAGTLDASGGGADATPHDASGHDATWPDATANDAGPDTSAPDAPSDATPSSDASDGGSDAHDAAPTCAELLKAAYAADILPPGHFAGIDLTNGGAADGGVGSGGITIDQTGLLACADYVEPTALDGGAPAVPGYRDLMFGGTPTGAAPVVDMQINVQSRAVEFVSLNPGYTGQLKFHSRAGGAYGTHVYAAQIQSAGDDAGTTGALLRDGAPFAADWNYVKTDGGRLASAWANEIYDGLMATYAPSVPAVGDCYSAQSTFTRGGLPFVGSDCLFLADTGGAGPGGSLLGLRPLGLYLTFNSRSNQVSTIYTFWHGADTSCATPQAALEQMKYSPIFPGQLVQNQYAFSIGGASPMQPASNPAGLTVSELDSVFGCGGASFTPPDNGYGGMQWGGGAVAAEYQLDSGVNYKVFAQNGYLGNLSFALDDGGTYAFAIGSATVNGAPITIDWTSAASANPTLTSISNAWYASQCTADPDTDCAAAGDCTIVADDGKGHSTFSLAPSADMVNNFCGYAYQPVTIVFPKGSSVPSQVYVSNAGGK